MLLYVPHEHWIGCTRWKCRSRPKCCAFPCENALKAIHIYTTERKQGLMKVQMHLRAFGLERGRETWLTWRWTSIPESSCHTNTLRLTTVHKVRNLPLRLKRYSDWYILVYVNICYNNTFWHTINCRKLIISKQITAANIDYCVKLGSFFLSDSLSW